MSDHGKELKKKSAMSENSNDDGASALADTHRLHNLPFGELAASWLAAIIESADDAIISKTLDGIITSWNTGAMKIFGYTAEETVGKSVTMLIPDELKEEEKAILSRIRKGERVEHYETIRVTKEGKKLNISLTVSPITSNDGTVIGASKIARDITEKKHAEAQLMAAIKDREQLLGREQEARQQAEIASRTKDEFLSMLSHELRTPLNAILGWSKILTTGALAPEAVSEALEKIERNARLQARLIEDMLDVSRIMSGKLRLDAQPVDLTSVIHAAVDTLRPASDAKDIRIHVVLDFGSGVVLGDPVRLQQVIWNLLSNAIKFTPKHGSVKVNLERVDSRFEISVADTGPGIEEEFLPYVFERFKQADSSSTKTYGGLGLGLTIVRQIVEMHGGTVEAANLEGSGALFVVKLPVMAARQRSTERGERELAFAAIDTAVSVDCPPELDGVKVLALDDDADSRLLISTILQQCGVIVKTCESVPEALSLIEEFVPDVIVSDIGMPEEDGYSFIRKLRAAGQNGKRTPAVALTAFAGVGDRMKALSAGFNMHVPKPVEPAELMMVIASLVRRD
jgi:PAS domain S-box-containing protein